jgi:hypothetical protein
MTVGNKSGTGNRYFTAHKKRSNVGCKSNKTKANPHKHAEDTKSQVFVQTKWRGRTFQGSLAELEEYVDFLRGIIGA